MALNGLFCADVPLRNHSLTLNCSCCSIITVNKNYSNDRLIDLMSVIVDYTFKIVFLTSIFYRQGPPQSLWGLGNLPPTLSRWAWVR